MTDEPPRDKWTGGERESWPNGQRFLPLPSFPPTNLERLLYGGEEDGPRPPRV